MVNGVLQPDELTGVLPDQSKREEMLAIAEQELERLYVEEGLDLFKPGPARVPYLDWNRSEKKWDLKWESEVEKDWGKRHRFTTIIKE